MQATQHGSESWGITALERLPLHLARDDVRKFVSGVGSTAYHLGHGDAVSSRLILYGQFALDLEPLGELHVDGLAVRADAVDAIAGERRDAADGTNLVMKQRRRDSDDRRYAGVRVRDDRDRVLWAIRQEVPPEESPAAQAAVDGKEAG